MNVAATEYTYSAKRIMNLSGVFPSECSCEKCKDACKTPCLGTPEDIEALIKSGFGSRLAITQWVPGMLLGLTKEPILMIQPRQSEDGWCTFRTSDGFCELHDKGLKPLEGKLTSCRPKPRNWTIQKDFTWLIAKEWLPLQYTFRINLKKYE